MQNQGAGIPIFSLKIIVKFLEDAVRRSRTARFDVVEAHGAHRFPLLESIMLWKLTDTEVGEGVREVTFPCYIGMSTFEQIS